MAYATYEASDMKGLYLDQRTLLRTLKVSAKIVRKVKVTEYVTECGINFRIPLISPISRRDVPRTKMSQNI
jgi:hypothetical protein